jgi:Cyclophilin-like family
MCLLRLTSFIGIRCVSCAVRRLGIDHVLTSRSRPGYRRYRLHAPSGDLVFYYGDVGYWNGIVRVGRFDTTMELIEHQADNFKIKIERSQHRQKRGKAREPDIRLCWSGSTRDGWELRHGACPRTRVRRGRGRGRHRGRQRDHARYGHRRVGSRWPPGLGVPCDVSEENSVAAMVKGVHET